MNVTDVQKLAELRKYIVEYYESLDGAGTVTAVVNQHHVAHHLETIIRSLDDLMQESRLVSFQK